MHQLNCIITAQKVHWRTSVTERPVCMSKSLADEALAYSHTVSSGLPALSSVLLTTLGYENQVATILSLNRAIIHEKLPVRPYCSAILDYVAGQPLAPNMQCSWRMRKTSVLFYYRLTSNRPGTASLPRSSFLHSEYSHLELCDFFVSCQQADKLEPRRRAYFRRPETRQGLWQYVICTTLSTVTSIRLKIGFYSSRSDLTKWTY